MALRRFIDAVVGLTTRYGDPDEERQKQDRDKDHR